MTVWKEEVQTYGGGLLDLLVGEEVSLIEK